MTTLLLLALLQDPTDEDLDRCRETLRGDSATEETRAHLRALADDLSTRSMWRQAGDAELLLNNPEAAAEHYTRALEADATDARAALGRARARLMLLQDGLLATGGPDRAAAIEAIDAIRADFAAAGDDGALADAWARSLRGEHEALAETLAAAIDDDTRDPEWYLLRAIADPRGAEQDLSRAVGLDQNFAAGWFHRGVLRVRQGDLPGAIADGTQALACRPGYVPALRNRAEARRVTGDLDGALEDYNEVLRLRPDSADALAGRGGALTQMGRLEDALRGFDEALALDPSSTRAWVSRGMARLAMGRTAEAAADFDEAVRLDPRDADVYVYRAEAHRVHGDADQALADYDRAIELNPANANAYIGRGAVRHSMGDLDGAVADFSRALELDPTQPAAFANRGYVREQLGDRDGAAEDYRRALTLAPADWPQRESVNARLRSLDNP